MKYYPEKVDLSPNVGRKGDENFKISPKYIILHHSYGSFVGGVSWCKDPDSDVSYHYLIDSDGSRVQLVYDTKRAWHAGVSKWDGIVGLNSHSLGVAFWGDTYTRPVKFAEVDSCAEKCIYLMQKFGIPIENILRHQQVSPKRKNDPAPQVMQRVLDRIKERMFV